MEILFAFFFDPNPPPQVSTFARLSFYKKYFWRSFVSYVRKSFEVWRVSDGPGGRKKYFLKKFLGRQKSSRSFRNLRKRKEKTEIFFGAAVQTGYSIWSKTVITRYWLLKKLPKTDWIIWFHSSRWKLSWLNKTKSRILTVFLK